MSVWLGAIKLRVQPISIRLQQVWSEYTEKLEQAAGLLVNSFADMKSSVYFHGYRICRFSQVFITAWLQVTLHLYHPKYTINVHKAIQ